MQVNQNPLIILKEYFIAKWTELRSIEINRYSKLTDLRNEDLMDLESATKQYGIIDVQLLDFAGSLYLNNKNWTIHSGFNKLFSKNEVDNESLLLEHKLKLVRYMRNFEHENALTELEN